MSASDLADLSSLAAQLDEVQHRITTMAERYGTSPDSAVAADLYAVERALLNAGRALQRAATTLERGGVDRP
jgi:hypothetical protein